MVFHRITIILATALLAACATPSHEPAADLVFRNGAVYTVNERQPWASAVAVAQGRIVYVGDEAGVERHISSQTQVLDLAGRMLMPGFHDSHMHPMAAGTRFLRCQMGGLAWPKEVLDQVRACASGLPQGAWFRGVGLDEAIFDAGVLKQSILDIVLPQNPAFVTTSDGYRAWANGLALEAAGLAATVTSQGNGGPDNGVLDNSRISDVYSVIPLPDTTQLRTALRLASEQANALGITSVNAAKVWPPLMEAYLEVDAAAELTLRVQASQAWVNDEGLGQMERLAAFRQQAGGRRLKADAVKLTVDGDILYGSAALLRPYEGTDGDFGPAMIINDLDRVVRELDAAGFQVHMHVYGDRAVRAGLDAIEAAIGQNGPGIRHHQLAHVALVDPDDLPRFRALGVTANIQPLWAWLDDDRKSEIMAIGAQRARHFLAFNDLFASGANVVAGSDWISESMNPLYSIQVAVTRRPPGGGPEWSPAQKVSLEQMIRAYTINGARLAGQEQQTGSVEAGKAADLVVLEKNLFEVDPMGLKDVRVMLTLLEGETVYRHGDF
jgi:predicted amidohydrolase YtcJ